MDHDVAEFRPDELYVMPAHFGPRTSEDDGRYDDVITTIVTFGTDPLRAATMLPPGFELTDPATVVVAHAENRGVHFMAGGGYNFVGVNLAARFRGTRDDCVGSYSLAVWEDEFFPVMLGRELLGVPKFLAEVPDARVSGDRREFGVSEHGTPLLDVEAHGLAQLDEQGVAEVQSRFDESQWMGWRFLAPPGGRGLEVSYPTAIELARSLDAAWIGAGSVEFHLATREQAPLSHPVASALATLPVLSEPVAVVTRGSVVQGHARRLE